MRLNLGCGLDIKQGYVNVDFRKLPGVDVVADLSANWPFKDGCAEEILLLDFLEHFPYRQTSFILMECHRVLADGGTVVIQVPDGEHLTRALGMIGEYLCNRCGGTMGGGEFSAIRPCQKCGQTAEEIADAAMRRLYGGQDYVGNYHQTCFTREMLKRRARDCGLEFVGYEEKDHQYANWNFKARFKRGDIW